MKVIEIDGRPIGPGHPCFIIAEAGVNHNGQVELAERLVDIAADARADAVKFQTFKADHVVSASAPKAEYQLQMTDAAESQLDMLRRLELSREAHQELLAHCQNRGVLFLSTPFDEASVELLDELGVPAFKIGSGEITNWPLLEYVARKGKPVILSTGMCYLSEVDEAVRVMRSVGGSQLVLLHCVSNYPADPAEMNLRAIPAMAQAFQLPVGLSDHTLGIEISVAAVALGACVIEKHLTIDREQAGPDHRASLEGGEFSAMVQAIRKVETALGDGLKVPATSEREVAVLARRYLVAAEDIPAGSVLTSRQIAIRRTGSGLPPALLPYVLGRVLGQDVAAGTALRLDMFSLSE